MLKMAGIVMWIVLRCLISEEEVAAGLKTGKSRCYWFSE